MIFGPVWSRRFGWSLGVNPFPKKLCTYSCLYCQLGSSPTTLERKSLCNPSRLEKELKAVKVEYDVITYVPEGEPTLDENLGKCGEVMSSFGKSVLLTNGSLAFLDEVREDMSKFDVVSLKVDAGSEGVWRKLNAPHPSLRFKDVLEGMRAFASRYSGKLVTETMVIKGINDKKEELERIAEVLEELEPEVAFLTVPTRPPAFPVEGGDLKLAYDVISKRVNAVVLSDDPFKFYPKEKEELIKIAKVHPVPAELVGDVPEGCKELAFSGRKFVKC